jgi:CRP/FNR family cyclic AMP-dependent transcriptional regulator
MADFESPSPRRGDVHGLLELDPELGRLLTDERRAGAERDLRVRVTSFPVGEWDGERLADAEPTHMGLLLLDGVLAREVVIGKTVSTELLGPGDLVRPWHIEGPPHLLQVTTRWNALSDVRLALLDRRTAALLGPYPEVSAVLVDRLSDRATRLAITKAISQLTRVDERLRALFWHLAERWGRVGRDGVIVPLVLSHRLIGELIGARRPTVSTALNELAREAELQRRDNGTWLLTGEPVGIPHGEAQDVIRQRRRLMPEVKTAPEEPLQREEVSSETRLSELRTSLEAAVAVSRQQREALDHLQAETRALQTRSEELRHERSKRLDELRAAALARRRS